MQRQTTRAFTLIELLIVVAIIAILAAIAVPNFLEAQTRAKVARVKNDMRTLATAIESYAVDAGKYPIDQNEMQSFGYSGPSRAALREANQRLTSPVSYITSVPNDPYLLYEDPAFSYRVYRWFVLRSPGLRGVSYEPMKDEAAAMGFTFYIRSIGPSVVYDIPSGGGNVFLARLVADPTFPLYMYDPTNGTVSFGYIFRSNKGELETGQMKPRR